MIDVRTRKGGTYAYVALILKCHRLQLGIGPTIVSVRNYIAPQMNSIRSASNRQTFYNIIDRTDAPELRPTIETWRKESPVRPRSIDNETTIACVPYGDSQAARHNVVYTLQHTTPRTVRIGRSVGGLRTIRRAREKEGRRIDVP